MKRDVIPVGDIPNYPLLAEIVKEVTNRYLGFGITPSKMAEIKYFIAEQINSLVALGEWVTESVHEGHTIIFKRIEVLQSDSDPNALKIIPVWGYEEE